MMSYPKFLLCVAESTAGPVSQERPGARGPHKGESKEDARMAIYVYIYVYVVLYVYIYTYTYQINRLINIYIYV